MSSCVGGERPERITENNEGVQDRREPDGDAETSDAPSQERECFVLRRQRQPNAWRVTSVDAHVP